MKEGGRSPLCGQIGQQFKNNFSECAGLRKLHIKLPQSITSSKDLKTQSLKLHAFKDSTKHSKRVLTIN